jgi:hypothetical protein
MASTTDTTTHRPDTTMTGSKFYLTADFRPGRVWSLVRMPDGTDFEGLGETIEEAEADAAKRWREWKAAGGTAPEAASPPCRVYWGSHGCMHQRGHTTEVPHECDCCSCEHHPDPDSGCVAKPPYYGPETRYYGEDAETLGLPLANGAEGKPPLAPQR